MTTTTYSDVALRTGTTIPHHLEAQATIPVATRFWRQGDLYIRRTSAPTPAGTPIHLTGTGHKVVQGEADRNSHILNGDGTFHPGVVLNRLTDYGMLVVPDGGLAVLTHTAEHGSIAFGPGKWRIWGQLSHEAELRRAAD
jgi:hypothetical protein